MQIFSEFLSICWHLSLSEICAGGWIKAVGWWYGGRLLFINIGSGSLDLESCWHCCWCIMNWIEHEWKPLFINIGSGSCWHCWFIMKHDTAWCIMLDYHEADILLLTLQLAYHEALHWCMSIMKLQRGGITALSNQGSNGLDNNMATAGVFINTLTFKLWLLRRPPILLSWPCCWSIMKPDTGVLVWSTCLALVGISWVSWSSSL